LLIPNCRGCDIVPEELEGDIPDGLYTETNASTHTEIRYVDNSEAQGSVLRSIHNAVYKCLGGHDD
jgi:hypothetical protein